MIEALSAVIIEQVCKNIARPWLNVGCIAVWRLGVSHVIYMVCVMKGHLGIP